VAETQLHEQDQLGTEAPEERRLKKTLRWWDGAALALVIPTGLFISVGFVIDSIGLWGALLIIGIGCVIGFLQNLLFAEMAAMFPEKSGGIAVYAHEAWRSFFTPVGPVAAFGYWIGWSVVLAIEGVLVGSLVQSTWFPEATWTLWNGPVDVGLTHIIAVGVIFAVWLFNVFGLRPAVWVTYATGAILVFIVLIMMFGTFLTGDWSSSSFEWKLDEPGLAWGGLKLALVWLFVLGWTVYATEVCATFAPEYKDTKRDTSRALRVSSAYVLVLFIFAPLGATGLIGEGTVSADPGTYIVPVLTGVLGDGFSDLAIAGLCTSLFMAMTVATADAARALYGIARADMTIKQLDHLNKWNVPGRAMTVDLIVNVSLVLLVGNMLGILFASNVGYITCMFFAVSGYAILRVKRPAWPRPIKLAKAWTPVAVVLAALNLVVLVVGATNPGLSGYGGTKEVLIGVAVLASSLVLYAYRRLVQDRAGLKLRDTTSTLPPPLSGEPLVGETEQPASVNVQAVHVDRSPKDPI
jgi:amino acid transporter